MVKKITGVICIICILALMSIATIVYANNQAEKANLLKTIEENKVKIAQIESAQNNLHLAAESMRLIDSNDDLIAQMSNKWLEFDNLKQSLVNDNISFQSKVDSITKEENSKVYLGEFTCVAYYTGNITSTGTKPTVGRTIAVDPKVIPYGSKVYIEGIGYRIAEDCGGGIKGNMIDIYMSTYNECIQHGRRKLKVYLIK